jgi:hypothetical protein
MRSSKLITGVLSAALLALAVVLYWHPAGGENVYDGVSPDVDRWLLVHTVLLLAFPVLGLAAFWLVRGLDGWAATVSRVSVVLFLVFYTAYEITVGVGTGILVDYANGLPPAEQAAVADAIQDYNRNWIVAEPASIALIVGFLGWVTAMTAAAFAHRKAGATWPVTLLIAGAALFAIHPFPVGPVGLVCLVAAMLLLERSHGRERVPAPVPAAKAAA